MFWSKIRPNFFNLHAGRNPHLTQCVFGSTSVYVRTCLMSSKSVERFKHECDRRPTDRPPYEKMCRNSRNRLRCKSNFA